MIRPDSIPAGAPAAHHPAERGFSMIELIVAMAVLTILMGAMMSFIGGMQERYTSEQRLSGVNQGGKTAMNLLTIDINQAGFPPGINTTTTAAITGSASAQAVGVSSIAGLYAGRPIVIDYGTSMETVSLTAIAGSNITGVFKKSHASGAAVRTTAYPYPQGILLSTSSTPTSTDTSLKLLGDIRGDGTLRYIEYRYTPPSGTTAGFLVRSDTDAFATSENPAVTVIDSLWDASIFSYSIVMGTCPGTLPTYVTSCTSSSSAGSYTYVTNVGVTLTMQTQAAIERDAGAGGVRQVVIRQQYFMPRNVINAYNLAVDGLQTLLPVAPGSVTGVLGM